METSDKALSINCDWDPVYLKEMMSEDFFEFSDLWNPITSDEELVKIANSVESYCPIVEDISMDDNVLCQAVENIEKE